MKRSRGPSGEDEIGVAVSEAHKEQLHRLHRMEGQVRGIARMVAEGRAPTDILTQLKAVRAALKAVEAKVLQAQWQVAVRSALADQDPGRAEQDLNRMLEQFLSYSRRGAGDGDS